MINEIYNISGPYQTENINVVEKILKLYKLSGNTEDYITHMERQGQDVRYSIDDSKLRALGWEPKAEFDHELNIIIKYYKNNFIW